jgi:hypothetical protein
LPGFGFIQDPLEYATRTHHSNMDVYDRVQPGDVMQAAAIEAWFIYNTAMRKDMLPRLDIPAATVPASTAQVAPPPAETNAKPAKKGRKRLISAIP